MLWVPDRVMQQLHSCHRELLGFWSRSVRGQIWNGTAPEHFILLLNGHQKLLLNLSVAIAGIDGIQLQIKWWAALRLLPVGVKGSIVFWPVMHALPPLAVRLLLQACKVVVQAEGWQLLMTLSLCICISMMIHWGLLQVLLLL